jgi:phage repressor protein C with HTH and peptisase S24 domain
MLSHEGIWALIDTLAARRGLSVSALARQAGLDATAFNPSKRIGPDGRLRWPSTESLAKVLEATGTSASELVALLAARNADGASWALATKGAAGQDGLRPPGFAEDAEASFVVPVHGRAFEPLYRPGDRLVVAPGAEIGPGDRVLATFRDGETIVAEVRAWGDEVVLARPDGRETTTTRAALAFVGRINWVSQ